MGIRAGPVEVPPARQCTTLNRRPGARAGNETAHAAYWAPWQTSIRNTPRSRRRTRKAGGTTRAKRPHGLSALNARAISTCGQSIRSTWPRWTMLTGKGSLPRRRQKKLKGRSTRAPASAAAPPLGGARAELQSHTGFPQVSAAAKPLEWPLIQARRDSIARAFPRSV
jgi:hypothetical protein